ncbi:MAG TPA: energy transducer TonB [Polyangiaceae bacterium]|nr:energy transducer TonB [Polyangiaceae bacterium]
MSLLVCGLLVACIAPPRKPPARILDVEDSARWNTPTKAVQGGAGAVVQSAALGGSGGAAQSAESVSSGSGGVGGSWSVPGSWHPTDRIRWKSALENYVPSVRPGNQTALNTARTAFAGYLNAMHNRIHPIFADSFLGLLDQLPATHPLNDPRLGTELEIILNRESGDVVRIGVIQFSGITAFDIAALESIRRAAPFGPPPPEIVSPDGNVYVHWALHRNKEACSTFNARPFLLKAQPKAAAD